MVLQNGIQFSIKGFYWLLVARDWHNTKGWLLGCKDIAKASCAMGCVFWSSTCTNTWRWQSSRNFCIHCRVFWWLLEDLRSSCWQMLKSFWTLGVSVGVVCAVLVLIMGPKWEPQSSWHQWLIALQNLHNAQTLAVPETVQRCKMRQAATSTTRWRAAEVEKGDAAINKLFLNFSLAIWCTSLRHTLSWYQWYEFHQKSFASRRGRLLLFAVPNAQRAKSPNGMNLESVGQEPMGTRKAPTTPRTLKNLSSFSTSNSQIRWPRARGKSQQIFALQRKLWPNWIG